MTTDNLTRARAVLAGLAEAEGQATPGPWHSDWYDWYIGIGSAGELCNVLQAGGDGEPQLAISPEDMAAIVALRNAAAPLLALAEAVGRLVATEGSAPWWFEWELGGTEGAYAICKHCDGKVYIRHVDELDYAALPHDDDCPALAIDAALAELAALDGAP